MASAEKLKILFLTAYARNEVQAIFKKGLLPSHFLFGAAELERCNMEVLIPNYRENSLLNKVGRWFDIGLLEQQIRAILILPKCDIIYAPFAATNTKLIILCKLIGLIHKPVVILVHDRLFGKPSRYTWVRILVKRLILKYDTIIFLSNKMKLELINAYTIDPAYAENHFLVSDWGASIDFFKKYASTNNPEDKPFIMSSGHSGRDFDILIRAAEKIDFPFKIYCRPGSYPRSHRIPRHVEIFSGTFPFEKICKDYADARIVLIPLSPNPEGTVGFSSLLEAMAMGKPVIMTRNQYIDIDFYDEKIGLLVEENDVDGWVNAITALWDKYSLLKEMGDNSMHLGCDKYNINTFAKELANVLSGTHQRHIAKSN